MSKETMTPRERWQAVMQRKKPDRIPMDYWGTAEATEKLMRHLGCGTPEEAFKKLSIDRPVTVQPRYVGPALPELTNEFGIRHRLVENETGIYEEVIFHPLAEYKTVEDIQRNFKWPTADWWDYADIPNQIKGKEMYPIRGGGSEPLNAYKSLRGGEQAFLDMIENPEIIQYCLDKLFDLAYQKTVRIYEQIPGKVMITYVAEDMGGQDGLMYSPDHIHQFLFPGMKRMIALAHQAGAYTFHHNDGAIRRMIPDIIGLGLDILNPIQWRCPGMEREGLKRNFGDKIVFHGAVDNQYTLPFGSVEEVRQEVAENIRILGAGGGYILGPCHNVQSVSPPENVVALYKAGLEFGWQ